jgi:C-terminal processing protease CtpA/Prc
MLRLSMHLLTDRALDNLVALARQSGIVRFFHPCDPAVDWNALILAGVQEAEPAAPEESDRTLRLAILVEAWPVFQHFYPYWDVVDTDWDAALRTALRSAATDPDDAAFTRTLRRFVAGLEDGHGGDVFRTADPLFRPPVAWDWIDGHLVALATDPAHVVPLRRGDLILAIDGVPSAEALATEEELTSAATPQSRRSRALATLAAGRPGSEIRLDIQSNVQCGDSVILRRSLPLHALLFDPALPAKIAEVRPGIIYVDLRRATDEDFQRALGPLAAARGVVFDLRGQPAMSKSFLQHLTDHPLRSAHWDIPVVPHPDRQGVTWNSSHWTQEPATPRLRGKIAFLTNGASISYAETLLGIAEHYRLGEIVGGPSAGTNGNVAWLHLPGGVSIRWTALRVRKHDGTRHHGVGIQPTVPVSPTLEGIRAGRDEVLEKGMEIVSRSAAYRGVSSNGPSS